MKSEINISNFEKSLAIDTKFFQKSIIILSHKVASLDPPQYKNTQFWWKCQ